MKTECTGRRSEVGKPRKTKEQRPSFERDNRKIKKVPEVSRRAGFQNFLGYSIGEAVSEQILNQLGDIIFGLSAQKPGGDAVVAAVELACFYDVGAASIGITPD